MSDISQFAVCELFLSQSVNFRLPIKAGKIEPSFSPVTSIILWRTNKRAATLTLAKSPSHCFYAHSYDMAIIARVMEKPKFVGKKTSWGGFWFMRKYLVHKLRGENIFAR